MRLSFLVHLFQFDAGIHSRSDSLAISAAGQPLEVFGDPGIWPTDITPSVPSGPNPQHETQPSTSADAAPESHEVHNNQDAGCQTEVVLHGIFAQDRIMQSDIPPHIWQRLQSMCLQPSWAGSDELECVARIYQPFLQHVVILPCLSWDAEQQLLWSISGAHVCYDLATSIVLLVETRLHWFLVRIDRLHTHFRARFFGCPEMHVRELNALLHQICHMLGLQMHSLQAFFMAHESPEDTCGFAVLWHFLQSEGCTMIPFADSAVSFLQNCACNSVIQYIGENAMQRWQTVTQDHTLILFAFATRAHFLREMLQTFRRDSFRVGGTRRVAKFPVAQHRQQIQTHWSRQSVRPDITESHESFVCTLSSLALRFDQFYGMRIGEARHLVLRKIDQTIQLLWLPIDSEHLDQLFMFVNAKQDPSLRFLILVISFKKMLEQSRSLLRL